MSRPSRFAVAACVGLAAAVGVVSLIGWWTGTAGLVRFAPTLPAIKFNTVLAVLALALAVVAPRRGSLAAAGCAALIGLGTVVEYAVGAGPLFDQLVVADQMTERHPGRMAAVVAIALTLLAGALLATGARRPRLGRVLALVAAALSSLLTLAWAYDLSPISSTRQLWAVAPQTAVTVLLMSIAVAVICRAHAGPPPADDPGALLVRRLVPVAGVGLPVLGLAALLGERAGGYGSNTTTALTVVSSALLIVAVALAAGRRVSRSARTTQDTLAELTALRVDLERQVDERAELLQHRTRALAVLEDRQRIAADLHDIVIQRLFAAGMLLQSTPAADPAMRERVDTTVGAMDAAIRDLRTSIFELNAGTVRPALRDALAAVCGESEAILGFAPQLIVDDPTGLAEALSDDVLAVAREGLANVARHAGASAVTVILRGGTTEVSLTVTDDGRGMGDSGRTSGTGNVRARAREHGGDCTWTTVLPSGTELRWTVPVGAAVLT